MKSAMARSLSVKFFGNLELSLFLTGQASRVVQSDAEKGFTR
jgi:hypothetical protein